jgi:hypothetical protein
MSFYYFDNYGHKIGPINSTALKQLAANGTISPETRITNDKGDESIAGKISGLIFRAPEYFTAEEIFNPNNIDLNSIPPQPPLPPNNNSKTNFATNFLLNLIPKYPKSNNKKYSIQIEKRQPYRRIQATITMCNVLSNFSLYGGITITIILFFIFIQYTYTALLIPLLGFIISYFFWVIFGLRSDLLRWKIDIAADLYEEKSRSIHDSD